LSDKSKSKSKSIEKDIDIKKKKELSNDNSEKEKVRFIPPTIEEVKAYCEERHNNIDPEYFVAFYESKGWMVGKNKMADWKAAVRTWERNRSAESKFRESPPRDAFLEFLDEEAAKPRGT
jgi:hypothetical protein